MNEGCEIRVDPGQQTRRISFSGTDVDKYVTNSRWSVESPESGIKKTSFTLNRPFSKRNKGLNSPSPQVLPKNAQILSKKSILQNVRNIKTEPDSYEHEKKNIQAHLMALNQKLSGFEEIAKKLISSNNSPKHTILSPSPLIQTSPILLNPESASPLLSSLELNRSNKPTEFAEREKKILLDLLQSEKSKFEELKNESIQKEKKIKELITELECFKKEGIEKWENWAKEKVKDEEKSFNEKIEEKDRIVNDFLKQVSRLKKKVRSMKEEKGKLVVLLGKHEENERKLEENLKKWAGEYLKLQELLQSNKTKDPEVVNTSQGLNKKIEILEGSLKSALEKIRVVQLENSDLKQEYENVNQRNQILKESLERAKNVKRIDGKKAFRENIEKILNDKEKIISLKSSENFRIAEEKRELCRSLDEIRGECNEVKRKNEDMIVEIKRLSEVNVDLKKTVGDSQCGNRETAARIENLTDSLKHLKDVLEESNRKLMLSEEKNEKLQVENQKLTGKIKSFTERHKGDEEILAELGKDIESKDQTIEDLRSSLKNETLSKATELNFLSSELSQIKTLLMSSESKNESLAQQILSYKDKESLYQKTLNEKSEIISSYEKSLNDLSAMKNNWKLSLQTKNEFTQKMNEKEKEIRGLYEENEKRVFEIQQIRESFEKNERKLREELEKSEESLRLCKNQLRGVEDQILIEKKMKSQVENNIFEYISRVESLEIDLKLARNDLETLRAEKLEKQNLINQLETDLACHIETHSQESMKSSKTIQDLQAKFESVSLEMQSVQLLNIELSEKILEITKSSEKNLKRSKSNEQSLSFTLEKINSENLNLKNLLEDSKESLKKLKNQIGRIKLNLNRINFTELKHFLNDFQSFTVSKFADFKAFIKNPQHLNMFVTLFQVFSSNTLSEKSNFENMQLKMVRKIQDLDQENKKLKIDLMKNKESLEQTHAEFTDLREKTSKLETEIPNLKTKALKSVELEELVTSLQNQLENLNSRLADEAEKNKLQLSASINSIEKLNLQIKTLQENNESLKSQINAFQINSEKLNSQLKTHLENNEKLNSQKKTLFENTEQLNLNLKTLTTENSNLKTDLEIYNARIIEKNKQIEHLTERCEAISSDSIDSKEHEKQLNLKKQELLQINRENLILSKKLEDKNKYIEELSKFKSEHESLLKQINSLKTDNQSMITDLLDRDYTIKKLEDTIISMEHLIKSSEKTEEELRSALSAAQERFEYNLSSTKPQSPFLSPNRPPDTLPRTLTNESQGSKPDHSAKRSYFTDELNITPCKILKVIKAVGKKWVLCAVEGGEYEWKDENNIHISGADSLLEAEEDLEDIKAALGEYFRGSVLEAIESIKSKIDAMNYSDQFGEKFEGFKGEMFGVGLDLSNIDCKGQEDNFDQLNNELARRNVEILDKDQKIEKKKRTILLLKEQNRVLKDQIRKCEEDRRENEIKVKSAMAVNLPYLKQVFSNLIGKIKTDKALEDLVLLVYKLLEFTSDEIASLQSERQGKKIIKK